MTTARLAAIQRDLGLHPTVVGKPGRPGTFAPVAVAAHWTAVRSGPGNRAPALAIVRDGRKGLPGPLYGDLIPWQNNPDRLEVTQVTVGRTNNLGMCHRPTVTAAGKGAILPRRPPADTGGGNHLVDAVSADYHPAQGPPPPAMVEAFVRAIAARLIYRGLPAHAVLDHAQATRRKIDLLDHWPQPTELRARVAAVVGRVAAGTATPPPTEEDLDVIRFNTPHPEARSVRKLVNYLFTYTGSGGPPTGGWLPDQDVIDEQAVNALVEALERMRRPGWVGPVPFIDLIAEEVDHQHLIRHGVGIAVVSALTAAVAAAYAAGLGRSRSA